MELAENAVEIALASESALDAVKNLLPFCLWGNRSDLCYLKVSQASSSRAFQVIDEKSKIKAGCKRKTGRDSIKNTSQLERHILKEYALSKLIHIEMNHK